MLDFSERRAAFRRLHAAGSFVLPNPWDPGSSRFLQSLGFQALATTSAGFGFSRGLPDRVSALQLDSVLQHIGDIVAATDLPVNADFQSGYAHTPEQVAESVRRCVQTGVAGLSIEDATDDPDRPLYELSEAVERLRAARAAIDAAGGDVLLTGRAECFLVNHPEALRESIRRLQAYSAAGADVLYAPGAESPSDIRAIVEVAHPKPVNVLMSSNCGLTVADFAKLGVRRVSVGSALARCAWSGFIRAARELASSGTFACFEQITSFDELNTLFERWASPANERSSRG